MHYYLFDLFFFSSRRRHTRCALVTGVQTCALPIYLHDPDGVYVNLYLPSRVAWTQGGAKVALEQRTDYPVGARSTLALSVSLPTRLALRLRVPGWATGGATISVNGEPFADAAEIGSAHD